MRSILLAAALTSGCGGVAALSSEDIYGLSSSPKVWLAGLVRDARDGRLIAAATVQVQGESARSSEAGAFRIDNLVAGLAPVSASADGYELWTEVVELRPGANEHNVSLKPIGCATTGCASAEFCNEATGACEPSAGSASLAGGVTSRCDGGLPLAARVSISGASTCSGDVKAYYFLDQLPAGGPQTLSVGKAGYLPVVVSVTLAPGFNRRDVELVPEGGCSNIPAPAPCVCSEPRCQ